MSEDNRLEKDLVELAKRFANAGNALYFALSSTLVAFILHIACLSTTSWIHNGNTRSGLWAICNSSSGYECCKSVESITTDKKWLSASQVFISIGLFPGVIAALSVSMLTCVSVTSESKNKARRVSYMSNFIASFVTIIGVSVYGSRYKAEPLLKHLELSVSFILGIVSLFLFFISGVTLALQRKPGTSEGFGGTRDVEVNDVVPSASITGTLHTELDDNDLEEDNILWQINEGIDVVPSDDGWISGTMGHHVQLPEEHFNRQQMSEIDGLYNSYRSFHQGTEPSTRSVENNLCVICFDNSKEVALVPCGHKDFCSNCSNQLDPRICPECRKPIEGLIQLRF